MQSIITGQKIARRKPSARGLPQRPRGKTGIAGFLSAAENLGGRKTGAADFIFLEGAGKTGERGPIGSPSAAKSRAPRHNSLRPRGKKSSGLPSLAALLSSASAAFGRRRTSLSLPTQENPAAQAREGLDRGATRKIPRAALIALSLSLVAVLLILAAVVEARRFPRPAGGSLLPDTDNEPMVLLNYVSPELAAAEEESAPSAPPPPAMLELRRYTIRSGDSLASVAKRFGVSQDSIISLNGITTLSAFKSGVELKIPNMSGIVHRVRSGESLGSIARIYGSDTISLADANDLGGSTIRTGQVLFIPGAKLPASALQQLYGQPVIWPIRGRISSYFGYRPSPFTGVTQFHTGIDIVAPIGYQIKAAIEGRVADVGYNTIFGNYVIVNHSGGLQTLYGHLSTAAVVVGQRIAQGGILGRVGNTGLSTGPHLHFGVFKNGVAVNPIKYLK